MRRRNLAVHRINQEDVVFVREVKGVRMLANPGHHNHAVPNCCRSKVVNHVLRIFGRSHMRQNRIAARKRRWSVSNPATTDSNHCIQVQERAPFMQYLDPRLACRYQPCAYDRSWPRLVSAVDPKRKFANHITAVESRHSGTPATCPVR